MGAGGERRVDPLAGGRLVSGAEQELRQLALRRGAFLGGRQKAGFGLQVAPGRGQLAASRLERGPQPQDIRQRGLGGERLFDQRPGLLEPSRPCESARELPAQVGARRVDGERGAQRLLGARKVSGFVGGRREHGLGVHVARVLTDDLPQHAPPSLEISVPQPHHRLVVEVDEADPVLRVGKPKAPLDLILTPTRRGAAGVAEAMKLLQDLGVGLLDGRPFPSRCPCGPHQLLPHPRQPRRVARREVGQLFRVLRDVVQLTPRREDQLAPAAHERMRAAPAVAVEGIERFGVDRHIRQRDGAGRLRPQRTSSRH